MIQSCEGTLAPKANFFLPKAEIQGITKTGAAIDPLDCVTPKHSGNPLLLSAEFLHPNFYTERVNVGGECVFLDVFALRAGYEFNRDLAGFSAGFGLLPRIAGNKIAINYSYSAFDNVNRFSLNVAF